MPIIIGYRNQPDRNDAEERLEQLIPRDRPTDSFRKASPPFPARRMPSTGPGAVSSYERLEERKQQNLATRQIGWPVRSDRYKGTKHTDEKTQQQKPGTIQCDKMILYLALLAARSPETFEALRRLHRLSAYRRLASLAVPRLFRTTCVSIDAVFQAGVVRTPSRNSSTTVLRLLCVSDSVLGIG